MKQIDDPWYVRLPDGRVLRARSTEALRLHLEQGKIPLASLVRREQEDEWVSLEWTDEFNDVVVRLETRNHHSTNRMALAPSSGTSISSRLDPLQLQTVGVQGWITELLAALDSVLVSKKLLTAGLGSLILGIVLALFRSGFVNLERLGYGLSATVTAAGLLLVFSLSSALLLRLTYVEVTTLRPARWQEGFRDWMNQGFRLLLGFLLLLGGLLLLIGLLYGLTVWLLAHVSSTGVTVPLVGASAAGVGIVLSCLALVPLFFLSLLLGPILICEGCSIWQALPKWRQMLHRNLGRVLAYEILALSIGLLVSLPFALPVALVYFLPMDERLSLAKAMTCDVLAGLATAPLLAYLTVANVFIYLNMHYGTSEARRAARPN